jgi:hypothetical protein
MVDLTIGPYSITEERMNDLDFLITDEGGVGRIYIRNTEDGFDWSVYIKPFKSGAWIGIILFCIIVPVPMMVVKLGGGCYCIPESKIK